MNRFMGLMPRKEIVKEISYVDGNGLRITIQAGPNGWTIVWADGGTNYKDQEKTTEENFNEAYETAIGLIGSITEVQEKTKQEYFEEK